MSSSDTNSSSLEGGYFTLKQIDDAKNELRKSYNEVKWSNDTDFSTTLKSMLLEKLGEALPSDEVIEGNSKVAPAEFKKTTPFLNSEDEKKHLTVLNNPVTDGKNVSAEMRAKAAAYFLCTRSNVGEAMKHLGNFHKTFANPKSNEYENYKPEEHRFVVVDGFLSHNPIHLMEKKDNPIRTCVIDEQMAYVAMIQLQNILKQAEKVYIEKNNVTADFRSYRNAGLTESQAEEKLAKAESQGLRFTILYGFFKNIVSIVESLKDSSVKESIKAALEAMLNTVAIAIRPNFYKVLEEVLPEEKIIKNFSKGKTKRLEIVREFLKTDPTGITQSNKQGIKSENIPKGDFNSLAIGKDFANKIIAASRRFPFKRRHPWWDALCHIIKKTLLLPFFFNEKWNGSRWAMKPTRSARAFATKSQNIGASFFNTPTKATALETTGSSESTSPSA